MKRSTMSAPVLALALSLAGCGNQAENAAAESDTGTFVEEAGSLKRGKGVGTVTAINPAKGSVTLDHGAIPALKWPAMAMGFTAKPEQLATLEVGDKVDFELGWDGKSGSVTSIREVQ